MNLNLKNMLSHFIYVIATFFQTFFMLSSGSLFSVLFTVKHFEGLVFKNWPVLLVKDGLMMAFLVTSLALIDK